MRGFSCIFPDSSASLCINLSSALSVREMPHKSLTLLASSSSPTPKGICILTPPMRGAMAGDDDVDAAAIAIAMAGPKRQSTKTRPPLWPLSPAVFRASFAPRRSRSRQLSHEIAELRGLAWPCCNQRRYEESKNLKMKHFSKKQKKERKREKRI